MRILCLHGGGTNSRIFEAQTAAFRYSLGADHTYYYLDGSVQAQMVPRKDHATSFRVSRLRCVAEIEAFVSAEDEFLEYALGSSAESCRNALSDLDNFLAEEGSFDGVMAFSQGAAIAASHIIHRQRTKPILPSFRFAIFFSGGIPEDLDQLLSGGPRRLLNVEEDGDLIKIPTLHVWGRNDQVYPEFGPVLSQLCKCSEREVFIHEGGHEVPGSKDRVLIAAIVKLAKRTIARAS